MKSFKGGAPITIHYRRKPIKKHPDLCRLMAVIYFRESKKRFYFNLPSYYSTAEMAKLDTRGRVINLKDYDPKTLSNLSIWEMYAVVGIMELEKTKSVMDYTKQDLDNAIKTELKRGGVL